MDSFLENDSFVKPQPISQPRVNPLLANLRLPGETVRLPSRALTYDDSVVEPEVLKEGEVHVHPMATYEELLMKSPDLLFTGEAIVQTSARCIPQIKDPMRLLAKDVDFLLVVLRKLTYGPTVNVQYTHTCENAKSHSYKVNTQLFIQANRELDPEQFKQTVNYVLDNGQDIVFSPYLLRDFVSASQRAMSLKPIEEQSNMELVLSVRDTIIEGITPAIKSVDGISDQNMIREWLDNLPPVWINKLSTAIESLNQFGIDFQSEQVCQDCGEKIKINVPINPQSFFTQPSDQETDS